MNEGLPMGSDPDWISLATAVGTWAMVIVALLVLHRQNKTAKELTRFQVFFDLYSRYESDAMQKIRATLARRLLDDPKTIAVNDSALLFLETVAYMTRKGLIDRELVWMVFSIDLTSYYQALRHFIAYSRRKFDDETLYEEIEALCREDLREEGLKHPGAAASRIGSNPEAIREFLRWESNRIPE